MSTATKTILHWTTVIVMMLLWTGLTYWTFSQQ